MFSTLEALINCSAFTISPMGWDEGDEVAHGRNLEEGGTSQRKPKEYLSFWQLNTSVILFLDSGIPKYCHYYIHYPTETNVKWANRLSLLLPQFSDEGAQLQKTSSLSHSGPFPCSWQQGSRTVPASWILAPVATLSLGIHCQPSRTNLDVLMELKFLFM